MILLDIIDIGNAVRKMTSHPPIVSPSSGDMISTCLSQNRLAQAAAKTANVPARMPLCLPF